MTGPQSAFDPHGPAAREITELAWLLIAGGVTIFALVTAIAVAALVGPRRLRVCIASIPFIVVGGVVLPVVVLTTLLLRAFSFAHGTIPDIAPLQIEVVGEQWWWRVHYLDDDGAPDFMAANELRIPVGRTVELSLRTADVIHSFWVPKLAGKVDMVPGQVGSLRLLADRPGHSVGSAPSSAVDNMRNGVRRHAEPDAEFDAWRARQRLPASPPASHEAARGLAAFGARGCGVCHTIRGTEAAGMRGPGSDARRRPRFAGRRHARTRRGIARCLDRRGPARQTRQPDAVVPVPAGRRAAAIAAYLDGLR